MAPYKGTTDFFVHVGGVFNNQLCGGLDPGCARCGGKPAGCATSIPHRADIPNPFAAIVHIAGGESYQAGTALDLEHGLFTNATAVSNASGEPLNS